MATNQTTETLTLTTEERTWRVECFCEDGTDYQMVIHREKLSKDASGNVIQRDRSLPTVTRTVSQVMGDKDALQMLGLIKAKSDGWAQEDAEKAAAAAVAEVQP